MIQRLINSVTMDFPQIKDIKRFALSLRWGSLLLLLPGLLPAQNYQPMAVEGTHWILGQDWLQTPWIDGKYSLTIRGDSTLNGITYKKVWWETFELDHESKQFTDHIIASVPYALIRDDTVQRRVYAIQEMNLPENCPGAEEYMLFDFSVKERDTLDWCSLENMRFNSELPVLADSIRFTESTFWQGSRKTIYGVFATTLYQDGLLEETTNSIIEGFGYAHTGPFLEGNFLIDYCRGTSWDCRLLSSIPQPDKSLIKLFPNPAKDLFTLEIDRFVDTVVHPTVLQIITSSGKTIRQEVIRQQRTEISLRDLPTGLYFIRLNVDRFVWQSRVSKL